VTVIASRNIPQGIAALLAFNPDLNAEGNADSMRSAITDIRSGEVTTAVRSTTLDGMAVAEGQAIALLDGSLAAAAATANEALIAMLDVAELEDGSLVTLYRGAGDFEELAAEAAGAITATYAGVEVEVIDGGQPHYTYLVSIE
jgi:dihydroxyacetone kinase-like predicted kinase